MRGRPSARRRRVTATKILALLLLGVLALASFGLLWFISTGHRAPIAHQAMPRPEGWQTGAGHHVKRADHRVGGSQHHSRRDESAAAAGDNQQENKDNDDELETKFHLVFSTGCNAFQDWQSYVFFYQIYKSGQAGDVTRVASGCDEATSQTLTEIFRDQIQTLPTGRDRFHLHLTPDYSKTAGFSYNFFNKPFGLLHWMEHGLGFPDRLSEYRDTIFIVLDPDMFLLRPFQVDYTHDASAEWHQPPKSNESQKKFVIEEGRPFGQFYGFGGSWVARANQDIPRIVAAALQNGTGTPRGGAGVTNPSDPRSSHLHEWTVGEVARSYAAGPPYLAVASDLFKIVKTWAAVVVPVQELTKDHLSEMFAYSTAAAHLELPHQLAHSFMVSNPLMHANEGWKVIDNAEPPEEVCRHVRSDDTDPGRVAWTSTLPQVLHYCQRYFLGPYFFNKYKLPKDFLSCHRPLLKDPLDHEGAVGFVTRYDSSVTPNHEFNRLSPRDVKRHAFFLCYMIAIMNDAITHWKDRHCTAEDDPNYSKTFLFPKDKK